MPRKVKPSTELFWLSLSIPRRLDGVFDGMTYDIGQRRWGAAADNSFGGGGVDEIRKNEDNNRLA